MSRDYEPCYCDQACHYEHLLERILLTAPTLSVKIIDDKLLKEIKEAVDKYKIAQAEYADEDFDDADRDSPTAEQEHARDDRDDWARNGG